MKKRIRFTIAAFALAVTSFINAQDFQGQAIYFSKPDISEDFKIESAKMVDEGMKQKLMEAMKKATEKTFILTFDKTQSAFEEEVKLEAPVPSGESVMKKSGGDGRTYKNIKELRTVTEKEIFGKEFLVTDSLQKWSWQLVPDTKKIGSYTCYKAQLVIPVTEQEKAAYAGFLNDEAQGKTQFLAIAAPKETTVTAWYAPEIPVPNGPGNYWGLPGLILEVQDRSTTFLCSKVTINPKNKVKIKVPATGTKVTREEFDKIKKDKTESLKNRNGTIRRN